MREVLMTAIARRGGAITRDEGLTLVARHVWDKAVSSGAILRVLPGVFVAADRIADSRALDAAVQAYVPSGAISHIDGLRI
jgi:hypothetical protein